MPDVMDEWDAARAAAVRKAKFLGLTHYVRTNPGEYSADMVVFDAGSRAGYPGWEYDSDGSRREATDEERAMWDTLPDPPDDWKPED